jgi:hypothetical protein
MPIQLQSYDSLRLPLVGSTFTRVPDQAGTTSGIVGAGIVGSMIVGSSLSTTKDQHYINAIPLKIDNPLTGKSSFYVAKRPGFAVNSTPSAGNIGTAIRVWAGNGASEVISAFGSTNSTIYKNTTSLGALTGAAIDISETLVGTTPNLTITTDGNKGYFFPSGGAMTNIVDVDFPGNIAGQTITGGFVHLDGYAFIMTTSGRIYNSDLSSLASWTANNFISTNMKPDSGVGLGRYKNYIIGFGSETIELFYDAGNASGSPLQRADQGIINIGCINQYCIKEIDDTLAWIGTSAQSRLGVYIFDGLQPKKISNSTIEQILSALSTTSIFLSAEIVYGQTLLFVTSLSEARTYVYCLETDSWSEWISNSNILWHHMAGIGSGARSVYAISRSAIGGKVYIISPTAYSYQDDSNSYLCSIQTTRFDGGNSRNKFLDRLRIIGDQYTATNNISVSWSDDDYQTFSTARTIDLSVNDPVLTRCGSFKRRAFLIQQTNSSSLRLEAIELDLRQGTH